MKITLSAVKCDVGGLGGHSKPSERLLKEVKGYVHDFVKRQYRGLLMDYYIGHTGDDIHILMSHIKGKNNRDIHQFTWNTYMHGTAVAKDQGLYGAGQDLLKDAFAGNVKGTGIGYAEIEFEERPNEAIILLTGDKMGPGGWNLILYKAYTESPGLILQPDMFDGFAFNIMDVAYKKGDRVIKLKAPERLSDLKALLRDEHRFVIESIYTADGEPVAVLSTERLHNIAGKYTGKDDPIGIIRTQKRFPATGEVIEYFKLCPYITGDMRGSHRTALTPVKKNSNMSFMDGPSVTSALSFSVHDGIFTEPNDLFDDAAEFWSHIRKKAAQKNEHMREQEWFGCAMASMDELEYTGIMEKLEKLDKEFIVRESKKEIWPTEKETIIQDPPSGD